MLTPTPFKYIVSLCYIKHGKAFSKAICPPTDTK